METPPADPAARARIAAWQFEDAVGDRMVKEYPSDSAAREAYCSLVRAEKLYNRGLIVLIALSATELPHWCAIGPDLFAAVRPQEQCTIPGVGQEQVLLSNVPYMPPGWGILVELLVMLVILRKVYLEWRLQTKHFAPLNIQYVNLRFSKVVLVLVLLEVIDCVAFALYRPPFRLAFLSKTGYLFLLPGVQGMLACFSAVIMEFISIAAFLVGTIVFFAWISLLTFQDDTDLYRGKPVNKGLDTFSNAIDTMFVSGTTDSFLQRFLPTYTVYRSSGFLWLAFLVVVHVLLLSLVLDTLVSAYTTFSEHQEHHAFQEKLHGVSIAFNTLLGHRAPHGDNGGCGGHGEKDGQGHEHGEGHGHSEGHCGHGMDAEDSEGPLLFLSKDAFVSFSREYGHMPRNSAITDSMACDVFDVADREQANAISLKEFLSACRLLQYNLFNTRKYSPLQQLCPALWCSDGFQWFKEQVDGEAKRFDAFMNCVLLFNFSLVIVETVYDLHNWPETPLLENLELIFSLVYVAEVASRLGVYSWPQYWALGSNRFDLVTTILLLVSSVLESVDSEEQQEEAASKAHHQGIGGTKDTSGGVVSRYMNILRLMRLFRMLKQIKRLKSVQFMFNTVIKLVLGSQHILMTLGCVVFFFTSLSVQLWGGILYESNPKLEETEWKESKWYALNFNDFLMAFGSWFVSLLSEYLPEFTEAISMASNISGSWLIFPLFYIFGVMIVFELVMAFTIEMFVQLSNKRVEEEKHGPRPFKPLVLLERCFFEKGIGFHYQLLGKDEFEEED